jgi:hypothetical protein
VTQRTRDRYTASSQAFVDWAQLRRDDPFALSDQDRLLSDYMNVLFFAGSGVSAARYAVWGFAWVHNLAVSKRTFPLVTASFKGWKAAAPERVRDPMPYDALMLIIAALMACTVHGWKGRSVAAARLLPLQWDEYMRPSEVLELARGDLHPPYRAADAWAVVVRAAPQDDEGDTVDLVAARELRPRTKPTKTGQLDGTVLIPDAASVLGDRGWLSVHLQNLFDATSDGRLSALSLHDYNIAIQWAAGQAGLESLCLSPHSARHGGPSHDAALNLRSLADIQTRGQWASKSSVARYRKAGQLRRQENKMTRAQRVRAKAVAAAPIALLWP